MNTVSAHDVAQYFLYLDNQDEQADGISNMKMQKLVYYAYGFHLAYFRHKLFNESIEAWKFGPVCETLYRSFNGFGRQPITFLPQFYNPNALSEGQKELLEDVYQEYGQFSAFKLSDMTHEEAPWLNGRARLQPNSDKGVMSESDILEHFEKIVSLNETDEILRECPDILERIAKTKKEGYKGIPLDDVIARLGISV